MFVYVEPFQQSGAKDLLKQQQQLSGELAAASREKTRKCPKTKPKSNIGAPHSTPFWTGVGERKSQVVD